MSVETIDSLLVSLGLDVDAKSFHKATDAITDVKNKSLQLLSAAGIGLGFKSFTLGVAGYTNELNQMSYSTRTATRDVEALRHAFKSQGMAADEANAALKTMSNVQRNIQLGILPAYPGASELRGKDPVQMLATLAGQLPSMTEQMQIRALEAVGIMPGSGTAKMLIGGRDSFMAQMADSRSKTTGISEKLNSSVTEFNKQMADLETNFNEITKSMGEGLLPFLNRILEITNNFISANPELVQSGIIIAGILGTLQGFKALAWIFGLSKGGAGKIGRGAAAGGGAASLLGKAGAAGTTAFFLEPLVDDLLVSAFGENERFQKIRTAETWSDFGRAIFGMDGSGPTLRAGNEGALKSKGRSSNVAQYANLTREAEVRHGLPAGLLSAIMQTESGGNRFAESGAGAKGLFQFMDPTAREFGLTGRDVYDPEKSTDAAARYMKQLLKRYGGNVDMALAAYNWGMGNLEKKGLANAPEETRNYVPKVKSLMGGDYSDAIATANGQFSSPEQTLPGSSYSPSTESFTQTNYVTIHTGANAADVGRELGRYSKNAAGSFRSDVY